MQDQNHVVRISTPLGKIFDTLQIVRWPTHSDQPDKTEITVGRNGDFVRRVVHDLELTHLAEREGFDGRNVVLEYFVEMMVVDLLRDHIKADAKEVVHKLSDTITQKAQTGILSVGRNLDFVWGPLVKLSPYCRDLALEDIQAIINQEQL